MNKVDLQYIRRGPELQEEFGDGKVPVSDRIMKGGIVLVAWRVEQGSPGHQRFHHSQVSQVTGFMLGPRTAKLKVTPQSVCTGTSS